MKKLFLALFTIILTLNFTHSAEEERYYNGRQYLPLGSPDRSLELAVSMFRVQGYSGVNKFGFNSTIEVLTAPEDVWEGGGLYPYDTFGTAPILYLSSSNASDTQPIMVTGLDIDGNEVEQTITLTGQTNALLTTPLWRVYRLQNEGDEGDDINGTVYCHTDAAPTAGVPTLANTRAIIEDGNNQTLMAIYTIPKGKIGFLYRGEMGVQLSGGPSTLSEFARIQYKSRRLGKVFKVKKDITCIVGGGSAIYQNPRSFPDIIPALTDIRIEVNQVSEAMGVFATFDIMLIDEKYFPTELLQAIGQYGY